MWHSAVLHPTASTVGRSKYTGGSCFHQCTHGKTFFKQLSEMGYEYFQVYSFFLKNIKLPTSQGVSWTNMTRGYNWYVFKFPLKGKGCDLTSWDMIFNVIAMSLYILSDNLITYLMEVLMNIFCSKIMTFHFSSSCSWITALDCCCSDYKNSQRRDSIRM